VLYYVDIETGTFRELIDDSDVPSISGGFNIPTFSPDGRTIAFFSSEAFWVMNNDGTGITHVADWVDTASKGKHYIYTGTHILWAESNGKHYRADVATGTVDSIYQVDGNNGLFGSRDGRRTVSWSHPEELEPLREFAPVIDYSADFTSATHYRSKLWGHGWFVSGEGKHAVINCWNQHHYSIPSSMWYGGHHTFAVVDLDEDTLVKTFESPGIDQNTGTYSMHYVPNSNTHMVVGTCTGDCTDRDGHWWVIDYVTEEAQEINFTQIEPIMGDNNPNMNKIPCAFLGDLPDLAASDPIIALSPTRLAFAVGDAPQSVAVTNDGAGTLTDVSTRVSNEARSWLSVTRSGTGNSQTITTTVDTTGAGLTTGVYYGTVEVSGGGAINSPTYTVTLTVGNVMAPPSDLQAVSASVPPSVTLTWTDNTGDELGFLVERREDGGTFAQIAAVGADETTYTDTAVADTTYDYRVRAYTADDTSSYSPVATAAVTIVPYAIVTTPTEGASYNAGDTVYIQWTAHDLPLIEINYSSDEGETWVSITEAGGVEDTDPRYGNYPWVVPNVSSSLMIIRVNSYQEQEFGGNSGIFTVNGTGVRLPHADVASRRAGTTAALYDCRGRFIAAGTVEQLKALRLAGGLYTMRPLNAPSSVRAKMHLR
ncbi:MAG: hypothetical protein GF331_03600, partial [Chitinivibrionales bacterium]|nr:hypothetical protein [Chitinivibrionales bacterium]